MNDWISIKDKLPELNQEILVLEQGYSVTGETYYSDVWIARYIGYRGKRHFVQSLGYNPQNKSSSFPYDEVTHWMPMPEKIRTI